MALFLKSVALAVKNCNDASLAFAPAKFSAAKVLIPATTFLSAFKVVSLEVNNISPTNSPSVRVTSELLILKLSVPSVVEISSLEVGLVVPIPTLPPPRARRKSLQALLPLINDLISV